MAHKNKLENRLHVQEGDAVELVARLHSLVYSKPDAGFSVQRMVVQKLNKGILEQTFVGGIVYVYGYGLPAYKNINFNISGVWRYKREYDRWQVEASSYEETMETDKDAIINFLVSGPIKGIGEKTAEKVYEVFGSETMSVLQNEPDRLLAIRGINQKTFKKIVASWEESRKARQVISLLYPYGFEAYLCMRAYKRFGNMTGEVIVYDTYRLCEVPGFDFIKVDSMALRRNLPQETDTRISAAIRYVLKQNEVSGNLGMDAVSLDVALMKLLEKSVKAASGGMMQSTVRGTYIASVATKMLKRKDIRHSTLSGEALYYLNATFETELAYARKLVALKSAPVKDVPIEEVMSKTTGELEFALAPEQEEAVRMALMTNVLIVTGGPGVGKTTVLKAICRACELAGESVLLLSTTGKAAKQMTASTGRPAQTIDSALCLMAEEGIYSTDKEVEEGLTVCDEVSMMDIFHAQALVKAIKPGNKLVLVGDVDQLPSVGPGAVLRDTIESGCIPVVRLKTIFRQKGADGAKVVENSSRINAGNTSLIIGNGFRYSAYTDDQTMSKEVIKTYLAEVMKYGLEDVVCLIPTKDTAYIGVNAVNAAVQGILNPGAPDKSEIKFGKTVFRAGDLVMNIKNDLEKGVVNGDVGRVKYAYTKENVKTVTCSFDERLVEYRGDEELGRLMLAYAMTVHKSQGSEYASVVIALPTDKKAQVMMKRNLLYTAVSRSKREVHLLGAMENVARCIQQQDTTKRRTLTAFFLRRCEEARANVKN